MGQAIRVQPSQADKNRASMVAQATLVTQAVGSGPLKLYVGGLVDTLENITEDELKKLFSPFGEIEFIDLHRDPYTNKCKGYAFIQYKREGEAKEAMSAMNGFQLAGREIKVGVATAEMATDTQQLALGGPGDSLEDGHDGPDQKDGPGGMLKDANARMALMQKLQRPGDGPVSLAPGMAAPKAMPGMPSGGGPASQNVILKGMFNAKAVPANDPEFFNDIKEDVEQECKKHGNVAAVWVDKSNPTGNVWVRFNDVSSSMACQAALDRRWFAGTQILAEFTTDQMWTNTVR